MNVELIISGLKEKNWCVIEDFFPAGFTQDLLNEAKQRQAEFSEAGIGQQLNRAVNKKIRSDQILWLDESTTLPASCEYLRVMEQLRQALNQEFMLGLFELECHFAIYPPGSFYQKHVDQFQGSNRRELSIIYYLNSDWQASDGGSLQIYDPQNPEQCVQAIYPKAGTFVCFLSNGLPHEVTETRRTRYSLTGWFLRRS